jgi:carboxymethylenebutenolidase
LPGVVVIQEIGGLNEHMEDVTRRIAAAGYVALAPDLYAVKGERPAALGRERVAAAMAAMRTFPPGAFGDPAARDAGLAQLPEAERRPVGETLGQLFVGFRDRMPAMLSALRDAVRYLRHERPETREQKVGCVGFCMGGGLSALLACEEPELSAAVVYYGGAPAAEKLGGIAGPVLAFYGEKGARVNAGIPAFEEGMRNLGKSYEHHIYPGAAHAFFNDDGGSYDVRAARDSFARMLTFFSKNLTG